MRTIDPFEILDGKAIKYLDVFGVEDGIALKVNTKINRIGYMIIIACIRLVIARKYTLNSLRSVKAINRRDSILE